MTVSLCAAMLTPCSCILLVSFLVMPFAAASVRVGQLLGSNQPEAARRAAFVSLGLNSVTCTLPCPVRQNTNHPDCYGRVYHLLTSPLPPATLFLKVHAWQCSTSLCTTCCHTSSPPTKRSSSPCRRQCSLWAVSCPLTTFRWDSLLLRPVMWTTDVSSTCLPIACPF